MLNWIPFGKPAISSLILAMSLCGAARADGLLDLVNAPSSNGTPYTLTFTAEWTETDIVFAGYQSPARLWAEDISLTTGSGNNLLGLTWNFTPFNPLDTTDAGQFNDGYDTGTNGLHFENGTGDLDSFDQLVSTVVGQSYPWTSCFLIPPRMPPVS